MSGPQKRARIRTHGAVGFMDPPSDEEVEVDINATSNTINGEVKYDYSTSTSKRTKTAATSIPQTSRNSQLEPGPISSNFRLNTGSKQPNPKDEEKRKQGASVMMATTSGKAAHVARLQHYTAAVHAPIPRCVVNHAFSTIISWLLGITLTNGLALTLNVPRSIVLVTDYALGMVEAAAPIAERHRRLKIS
ncbi:hypothetical protein GALMADRAFT_147491 [Galerina marginata CBS 339.88]|uniref:Uncharacterized protein n=1 Tax=Galerina marginata (strain CBS 339.88) TaxID=685588 RepID=A0A067SAS6_GALM3|nr:hypothetical protein GALMADRAFT_147491 [Galerina marginata CBS 339.88]